MCLFRAAAERGELRGDSGETRRNNGYETGVLRYSLPCIVLVHWLCVTPSPCGPWQARPDPLFQP